MDFLNFNLQLHKYEDLFKIYDDEDFNHYHCDICEQPYKSKVDALKCCSQKKIKFLEILDKNNIEPKKLLKNIDKLDEMFQKIEFGRNKHNLLCGEEFYPFYNLLFLKTLQEWNGIDEWYISDITGMGLYNPKDFYKKLFGKWAHVKAKEIVVSFWSST